MSFAKLVAQWMGRKGYAHPKDAAGDLGCSVSTAYTYVNEGALPPNTKIPGLARVLGLSERRLKQVIAAERSHKTQGAAS